MSKRDKTILMLLVAALIVNLLGAIGTVIKEDELEDKISEQRGIINQLEQQIEDLKQENAELEDKYFYEKQLAEYWYYYNVDDAC